MFILPVVKDHLSWETTKTIGRFIQVSLYIFILDFTPGFNILSKDNCKTRRDTFKFLDLVGLILEILL